MDCKEKLKLGCLTLWVLGFSAALIFSGCVTSGTHRAVTAVYESQATTLNTSIEKLEFEKEACKVRHEEMTQMWADQFNTVQKRMNATLQKRTVFRKKASRDKELKEKRTIERLRKLDRYERLESAGQLRIFVK